MNYPLAQIGYPPLSFYSAFVRLVLIYDFAQVYLVYLIDRLGSESLCILGETFAVRLSCRWGGLLHYMSLEPLSIFLVSKRLGRLH